MADFSLSRGPMGVYQGVSANNLPKFAKCSLELTQTGSAMYDAVEYIGKNLSSFSDTNRKWHVLEA
jgi:hypothetical protein